MKNFFFRSKHTSSQIWCFLKFPLCWGGGSKIKVAQNGVKHGLILEFLRSDEIFEIGGGGGREIRQKGFCLYPESKYERILYFKPCVYLAYFRSYGYLKIVKCIAMY